MRRREVSGGGSYRHGMAQGGGGRGYVSGGGNSFTHTYREGPGPRPGVGTKVGNSCAMVLLGLIFIALGCALLWFNEGWAIRTHRSLNEALDAHRRIPDATAPSGGELDDHLVHVSHGLTVDSPPTDADFGLVRDDAVSLTRNVEIYQWVETHRKERRKLQNGETEVRDTYSYNKKWVGSPVRSDGFQHPGGHENYGELPFEPATFRANEVRMGSYLLSNVFTRQLTSSSAVPAEAVKTIPNGGQIQGGKVYFSLSGGGSGVPKLSTSAGGGKDLSGGIDKEIVSINGEDKIMYSVKSTGETFPTKEEAERAIAAEAIEKKIVTVDGQDKIMYSVKATGETFPTQDQAIAAAQEEVERAIVADAIEKKIVTVDGQDKIMYSVKSTGETFPTQKQAIAAARKAPGVPAAEQRRSTASVSAGGGPQIGDVRIGFTEVRCGLVSVLGRLNGDTLTAWPSKQGPGYDVAILVQGRISAKDMVVGAQTTNQIFTWVKRAVGWLLNLFGFSMVTQIVSTAADITLNWIPLLGPMTTSIINLGLSIANFVLASTVSLLVASVAWVRYRPILGITLLVGSLGLFFLASQAGGKAKGRTTGKVY